MNTYIFPNPTPELFDFMFDLSQSHPEIQITITVETQNLASTLRQDADQRDLQDKVQNQKDATPHTRAKTINPDIKECPECHTLKYSKYFSKSGVCKKCNLSYQGLHKGPKENQEIQRNHEIIWGPESP